MGGWGRPWLWRAGPKQGQGLGGGWGQFLGPPGLEKALRAVGVGFRLKEQKGPRRAPHPSSQRAGDLPWEPSKLPGLKWVGQTPSAPLLLPPTGPLPPPLPSASFLSPQDQCGQGKGRALEGRGLAWELRRLPGPKWVGQTPSTPLPLLLEGPSHLPLLISWA